MTAYTVGFCGHSVEKGSRGMEWPISLACETIKTPELAISTYLQSQRLCCELLSFYTQISSVERAATTVVKNREYFC